MVVKNQPTRRVAFAAVVKSDSSNDTSRFTDANASSLATSVVSTAGGQTGLWPHGQQSSMATSRRSTGLWSHGKDSLFNPAGGIHADASSEPETSVDGTSNNGMANTGASSRAEKTDKSGVDAESPTSQAPSSTAPSLWSRLTDASKSAYSYLSAHPGYTAAATGTALTLGAAALAYHYGAGSSYLPSALTGGYSSAVESAAPDPSAISGYWDSAVESMYDAASAMQTRATEVADGVRSYWGDTTAA